MGCGCSKVSPAPATASVSVPNTSSSQAKSPPSNAKQMPSPAHPPQSATSGKSAAPHTAPHSHGANATGGHAAPPTASARASAVDIESSTMSLNEPGSGIHPVSTRASVQMPNPVTDRAPKPFEEKELEEKLLKLQRMREEEEREVPEVQEDGHGAEAEVHEIPEVQEEVHEDHDSDGEKGKTSQVAPQNEKPKESSAKKKGKILLQIQLKNNNEFMETKVKPNDVSFDALSRWSESFWGATNLTFSVVENDEIVQIKSEEQFQQVVQRHGIVDDPLLVYAQPKKIQDSIAEGDEEAAETTQEPTEPAVGDINTTKLDGTLDNQTTSDEPHIQLSDDMADLRLDKETNIHFRFINQDDTEMFSNVSNETSFWQITSIIRTAYGFPVCFRTSHFAEPLTTMEQYNHILSDYKQNDEKYITLYTERIDELDLETIDDFELMYQEKKEKVCRTQVFIRCTLGDSEPISCIFPIPFTLNDLFKQFNGVDEGVMSITASFANVHDVLIHDDGQLQELIRSYQHTLHKYFNISISHSRPLDEDTVADILTEKEKQLHLICHLDEVPLDMVCPTNMRFEDFKTQLDSLVNGLYKVTTQGNDETAIFQVDDAEAFQKLITDFSKTATKHLHLLITRIDDST